MHNKLHASVGYPLIENTTKIVASFNDFEFISTGKVIKDEGYFGTEMPMILNSNKLESPFFHGCPSRR